MHVTAMSRIRAPLARGLHTRMQAQMPTGRSIESAFALRSNLIGGTCEIGAGSSGPATTQKET